MKTIEEYLALPYTFVVRWNEDDSLFVARVREIPRCSGHGPDAPQAIQMAQENLRDWIALAIEDSDPIPVPVADEPLPSGKWLQRVARSIHAKAVLLAEQEGVSLNQLVAGLIAEAVGEKSNERGKAQRHFMTKGIDLEASGSSCPNPLYLSTFLTDWKSSSTDLNNMPIPSKYSDAVIKVIAKQAQQFGSTGHRRTAYAKKEKHLTYNA